MYHTKRHGRHGRSTARGKTAAVLAGKDHAETKKSISMSTSHFSRIEERKTKTNDTKKNHKKEEEEDDNDVDEDKEVRKRTNKSSIHKKDEKLGVSSPEFSFLRRRADAMLSSGFCSSIPQSFTFKRLGFESAI